MRLVKVLVVAFTIVSINIATSTAYAATPLKQGVSENHLVTLLRADFDGDGHLDVVQGQTTAIPDAYRRVIVRDAVGRVLLDISDQSFYYLVTTAGVPPRVLLTGAPNGNWLGVQAFMYDPASGRMERQKWNGEDYVRGRNVTVDPTTGDIRMYTEAGWVTYAVMPDGLKQRH